MQKYRVSILTVTIALALALRLSKIEYILFAPILPGIFATCLFADRSLRSRVVLWLSVAGGIALVRTYGSSMVYKDEWRHHGLDILGAIVFQLVCTAIVSICTLLILQRRNPGPWSKKIISLLRTAPLFSKILVVLHAVIFLMLSCVVYGDSGYGGFGAVIAIAIMDFPAFLSIMWIGPLLDSRKILIEHLLLGYVFIVGTIQWYAIGRVCTWLWRKFYDRTDPVIIPRNAQSCLDRSSKNSTASVPSTSIGAEDAKI